MESILTNMLSIASKQPNRANTINMETNASIFYLISGNTKACLKAER